MGLFLSIQNFMYIYVLHITDVIKEKWIQNKCWLHVGYLLFLIAYLLLVTAVFEIGETTNSTQYSCMRSLDLFHEINVQYSYVRLHVHFY